MRANRRNTLFTQLCVCSVPPEASRFHFHRPENYISMYHQEGGDTLYVGGRAMIYVLTFNNRGVRDLQVRPEAASPSFSWWSVGGSKGWGQGVRGLWRGRFHLNSQTGALPWLADPQRSSGVSTCCQSSESAVSFPLFSPRGE